MAGYPAGRISGATLVYIVQSKDGNFKEAQQSSVLQLPTNKNMLS